MKVVTLLCRGTSLKYINKLDIADHTVIVNSFYNELEDTNIQTYLSSSKTIDHVVSLGTETLHQMVTSGTYQQYNFRRIVLPYIKEVLPGIPRFLFDVEGTNGILPVHCLQDINKEDMISTPRYKFTAPSCGMDALLYCANELQPETINIVGMDFYDNSGYYINSALGLKPDRVTDEQAIATAQRQEHTTGYMKDFFLNFVERKSNIQFNLYTTSYIKHKNNNLKVNHYE